MNVKNIAATFLSILVFSVSFSQGDMSNPEDFPKNYFDSPLDIPLVLSGTFGELRSDHFHAGLDIKTQQRDGLNVYAAAEGYVSRIKISHWGYGKAIYITHPNGYTTVYAHLQNFSDKIEAYIKKKQYEKESFEIQVFPKPSELPVSKKELIALSGSTGGFVGPHLHFEIRDSSSEKPINPLFFGININDSQKPTIKKVIGYSIKNNGILNGSNAPIQLTLEKSNDGNFISNPINAFGKISFGVETFDRLDGASNKNGIYSLTMFLDGEKVHEFKTHSFAFSETKLINLLIDYKRFDELNQRIQKCFIEPENKLNMYSANKNNGILNIEDGKTYEVVIVSKDYKGNSQKVTIPIQGKKQEVLTSKTEDKGNYFIDYTKFNKFELENVSIAFPKRTFYENLYLNLSLNDSIVSVHNTSVPIHKKYTLTFNVDKLSNKEKETSYIAYLPKKGGIQYVTTKKQDSIFYTSTNKLGEFTLAKDTIAPSIKLKNFKDKQWLTHFNKLQVKINDKGSGIQSYRGEINNEWILMEYNVKNGVLTYNLNDKKFSTAEHKLKVYVLDNVGNSSELEATFYRKK